VQTNISTEVVRIIINRSI